jgi:hypothetical protein
VVEERKDPDGLIQAMVMSLEGKDKCAGVEFEMK